MSTDIYHQTLTLAKSLIKRASISPKDEGCQDLIINRLQPFGFKIEKMFFVDTDNIWLRLGNEEPVLAFIGHTDVVPPGDLNKWNSKPFEPTVKNGYLYGRGAADMKGSIAAMLTAIERFLHNRKKLKGSLALLITSDEEEKYINGTPKVVETLEARGEKIKWALVGEPSSTKRLGDIIKNGRRGSLHCRLKINGVQGHAAYAHLASNPIHQAGARNYCT